MAHYLLLYRGNALPENDAERQSVADEWASWEREAGNSILDSGCSVINGTSITSTKSQPISEAVTSFTIIEAANQDEAAELARSAPQLTPDTSVDIYKLSDSD